MTGSEPGRAEGEQFRAELFGRMSYFDRSAFAAEGGIPKEELHVLGMRLFEVARMFVRDFAAGDEQRVQSEAEFMETVRNHYQGYGSLLDKTRRESFAARKAADPELFFAGEVSGVFRAIDAAMLFFGSQREKARRKMISDSLRPYVYETALAHDGEVGFDLLHSHLMGKRFVKNMLPKKGRKKRYPSATSCMIQVSEVFPNMLADGTLVPADPDNPRSAYKLTDTSMTEPPKPTKHDKEILEDALYRYR